MRTPPTPPPLNHLSSQVPAKLAAIAIAAATTAALALLLLPAAALAHQPRLIDHPQEPAAAVRPVAISNPEISQAFYGELAGAAQEFSIKSEQPFRLYVGLLVPDLSGGTGTQAGATNAQASPTDLSVDIWRQTAPNADSASTGGAAADNGSATASADLSRPGRETVGRLDGPSTTWTPFYEEFGGDHYLWGPEFAADDSLKGEALKGRQVPAGNYTLTVSSPNNSGKYSLVVGDLEAFPPLEMLNALILVPQLKSGFFGESLPTMLSSAFVWGYVALIFALAFGFGLLYRFILRKLARRGPRHATHNIALPDRLLRLTLAIGLLIWAVLTTWSPLLIFLSGFCLFEAIFSWCGLYAAMGKNSCPV